MVLHASVRIAASDCEVTATADQEDEFKFAAHVHSYLQNQITLADAKAAVVSGIAAGLFVAYRQITQDWRFAAPLDLASVLRAVLQVAFLVVTFMSVIHAYAVLAPRMPDRYRRAGPWIENLHKQLERFARGRGGPIDLVGGGGLVRWPEIADVSRFPTTADYANAVRAASAQDLASDLTEHAAILARIVAEKYQNVRLAINYVVVAGFTTAVLNALGESARQ